MSDGYQMTIFDLDRSVPDELKKKADEIARWFGRNGNGGPKIILNNIEDIENGMWEYGQGMRVLVERIGDYINDPIERQYFIKRWNHWIEQRNIL